MAASVGDLAVRVGADITDLKKGMSDGSRTVGDFASKSGKQLRSTATQLAKVGAAATAAGAALVAGLYNKGATVIDQQAKMARSIGSTVVSVQTLERAAELAGISQGKLTQASAKLNARLGEAMRGTGEAAQQLEILGLNADDLSRMEADQRLAVLADRMRELGYSSSQAADVLRDFGIREEKLVGLMIEGGDAFRSARQEVHDFGMAVSDVDAAQIEAANDAMTSIGVTMQTVANTVAVQLAPYIQEIGARFGQAAKDSGGFKSEVEATINTALKGFGKFGNVLQGLRVVFKGLEVIVTGFGAVVASVIQIAAEGITKFTDDIIGNVNFAIAALNKLPQVDIAKVDLMTDSPFMEGLRDMAETARNRVGIVRGELHELAMQELPGDKIEKFLADVAKKSEETAQAVVAARSKMVTMPEDQLGGGESGSDDAQAKKDAQALEAIKARYLTEQELLRQHQEEMGIIGEEWDAAKFATEEEWRSVREQAERDYLEKVKDLNRDAYKGIQGIIESHWGSAAASTAGALKSIIGTMAVGSKTAFEIAKKWALADAIISTAQGIAAGVKLGWPMAIPAVAWAAATGMAQISQIRSQSFGGAGGAAASGNGTPGEAPNPVGVGGSSSAPPQQERVIRVEGLNPNSLFSGEQMVQTLEQVWKDGGGSGRLLFA